MKNRTEQNLMIAKFMGGLTAKDEAPQNIKDKLESFDDIIWLPIFGFRQIDKLHYDTSWEYIMPVVSKIEKISYVRGRHFYLYKNNSCVQFRIDRMPNHQPSPLGKWGTNSGANLLGAIHSAVIEFIEYYNATKDLKL